MPGIHLSKTEKDLRDWWNNSDQFRYPILRRVSVKGGLRGIQKLDIDFKYPLTVISGRNGSGKSTLLALATLAFHSPKQYPSQNTRRGYYTFSDFFFTGPGEHSPTGVQIQWEYDGVVKGPSTIDITKRSDKWMHYERRHQRPVQYLGIIRSVPAIEQSVLRNHFPFDKKASSAKPLNADFRSRLGEIMNRPYEQADVIEDATYTLRRAKAGGMYSSFNMGAGEDILIDLLTLFQEVPPGSLIAIEEIDLGLHPEALVKLAKHLQEIMLKKELQVIVTTHSQHFIDAVPREARVLVQRADDYHEVIAGPTTRLAMGLMTGQADPELNIYCEDAFAQALITSALPIELSSRCRIVPIGSNNEICRQVRFHRMASWRAGILVLWDGDVTHSQAAGWVKASELKKFSWARLPGAIAPEKWTVNQLDCEDGIRAFADQLPSSIPRAKNYIERMRAVADGHEIKRELARLCNISEDEVVRAMTRALNRMGSDPLKPIRNTVANCLEGREVVEKSFWEEKAKA